MSLESFLKPGMIILKGYSEGLKDLHRNKQGHYYMTYTGKDKRCLTLLQDKEFFDSLGVEMAPHWNLKDHESVRCVTGFNFHLVNEREYERTNIDPAVEAFLGLKHNEDFTQFLNTHDFIDGPNETKKKQPWEMEFPF